nr:NUDIX domain-containing protein [Streptomyces sp. SM12]
METRLNRIVLDSADPARLARFWAALIGGEPSTGVAGAEADGADPATHLDAPGFPRLAFRRVLPASDPPGGGARLEIEVADVAAAEHRARRLGARDGGADSGADDTRPPGAAPASSVRELRDPDGNPFRLTSLPGRSAGPEPLPPATGSMTLLAAAVVVRDPVLRRVVMLRRGPEAKFGRGLWDVPVGKCDPGEAVSHAAVRELAEETGLVVDPADLRLVHVVHGARGAEAPGGFLTVVFLTERWSGEPVNREPAKHAEVCWMPEDDLPTEVVFSADRLLTAALSGVAAVTLRGWS